MADEPGQRPENDNAQIRIRQIQYDMGLARKAGFDTSGEDYASQRNEIKRLRDQLKAGN
jgi:hypothetical protein